MIWIRASISVSIIDVILSFPAPSRLSFDDFSLINLLSEIVVSFSPNDLIVIVGGSEDWIYILEK